MKRFAVLLLLICTFSYAASQAYTQKTDALGASLIEEKRDISLLLSLLSPNALADMEFVCLNYAELDCSIEENFIVMRVAVPPKNGYYTLSTDYGFPFTETTLAMNRLPTDLFDRKISSILLKANLSDNPGFAKPLDLKDREGNLALSNAMQASGITSEYTIIMPNGESETLDLVALLSDSAPIVKKSYTLNLWLIFLVLGIGVLAGLAYLFFGIKRRTR